MIPILIEKLSAMILLVAVGYGAVRVHVLKSEDARPLSALSVKILMPCLVIDVFQIEVTPEKLVFFLAAAGTGMAVYLLWIVVAAVIKRPLGLDPVEQATLIYSNVGNLILPLVSMVLGEEMLFYAGAMQIVFHLCTWTHADMLLSGTKRVDVKRILRNPNVIALIVGLICLFTGLRVPGVIATAVSQLAGTLGPISMLLVGMVLAESDLAHFLRSGRIWLVLCGRLIVFPLLAMGALWISRVPVLFPELRPVLQVVFLALSAPPASTVSQLAVLYEHDAEEAGALNVLGTIACLVTLPLMAWVFEMIFM